MLGFASKTGALLVPPLGRTEFTVLWLNGFRARVFRNDWYRPSFRVFRLPSKLGFYTVFSALSQVIVAYSVPASTVRRRQAENFYQNPARGMRGH